ncbi:MAG: ATP-binding cassette domain-containing protein [Streptosporangiales bacterium]|nr:ATP-binding cassette domain-containing protein [Streptosporangiales bacterium]
MLTAPVRAPALALRGIGRSFPGVRALDDVTIEVRAGEVLALVGENGAGKSTLLRILSGDQQPDEGELRLPSGPVRFGSPRDARAAGVRVVSQEPELVDPLSVAENVFLGQVARASGGRLVRRRDLHRRTAEILDRYGFAGDLDPQAIAADLSPSQRQLVEIVRALHEGATVLALDEPTSSLSEREADRLLGTVERLRRDGVAIVYVSHRLRETLRLADRVAVLRDGRLVATEDAAALSEADVVRLMVGRPLTAVFDRPEPPALGDVRLRVEHLSAPGLHDVGLTVRAGEIVGLAGLVGAGRTRLARALYGELPLTGGRVEVDGRPVRLRHPRDAMAAGICRTPEDRKGDGLVMVRSVRENVTLAILKRLSTFRFVRRRAERTVVADLTASLRVKAPSMDHPVATLSGGNQQKVVLARALAAAPRVLVLDEPTRGVDVGAKAEIYQLVFRLARDGLAVVVVSSELPEVLGLADRILVLAGGRITGELSRDDATEERVLALAMPAEDAASGSDR